MSAKSKGIDAERELIHLLWKAGYAAVRVAGSGSSRYPSCDILASRGDKVFAFECKSIKGNGRYIPKGEYEEFLAFCASFGAQAWFAVRYARQPWMFLLPEDLKDTGIAHGITKNIVEARGLSFEELLN